MNSWHCFTSLSLFSLSGRRSGGKLFPKEAVRTWWVPESKIYVLTSVLLFYFESACWKVTWLEQILPVRLSYVYHHNTEKWSNGFVACMYWNAAGSRGDDSFFSFLHVVNTFTILTYSVALGCPSWCYGTPACPALQTDNSFDRDLELALCSWTEGGLAVVLLLDIFFYSSLFCSWIRRRCKTFVVLLCLLWQKQLFHN